MVTASRRPWLASTAAKKGVLECWRTTRARYPFRHLAHVLLDDHLHFLLVPGAGIGLDRIVGAFKRDATWSMRQRISSAGPLWQPRFYDHVVRDERDLYRHLDYIHFNPVKHGLCNDPGDYPWSSLGSWQERGVYPQGWARTPPTDLEDMDLE